MTPSEMKTVSAKICQRTLIVLPGNLLSLEHTETSTTDSESRMLVGTCALTVGKHHSHNEFGDVEYRMPPKEGCLLHVFTLALNTYLVGMHVCICMYAGMRSWG